MSPVVALELPGPPELVSGDARQMGRTIAAKRYFAGPENRALLSVVQRLIASSNGAGIDDLLRRMSPVSLVGPPGCGKTHLAQGVAAAWAAGGEQTDPDGVAVLCISANDFRRRLDEAIRGEAVAQFRARVRSLRLLVLEDLHRATAAGHFRDELTETLDAIHASGGVVLATMTKPLSESPSFDRQLISRFAGGLVVEVAPLSQETRSELLRQALADAGCRVDASAIGELSASLSGDARRVLQTAAAVRERFGRRRPVGREQAKAFLSDEANGATPPLREIATTVCRYYRLPMREVRSSSRKQHVVLARSVAVYLARQLTPLSYEEIGRFFGGRDHTTIMHNYQRIDARVSTDRALRSALEDIRATLPGA